MHVKVMAGSRRILNEGRENNSKIQNSKFQTKTFVLVIGIWDLFSI